AGQEAHASAGLRTCVARSRHSVRFRQAWWPARFAGGGRPDRAVDLPDHAARRSGPGACAEVTDDGRERRRVDRARAAQRTYLVDTAAASRGGSGCIAAAAARGRVAAWLA